MSRELCTHGRGNLSLLCVISHSNEMSALEQAIRVIPSRYEAQMRVNFFTLALAGRGGENQTDKCTDEPWIFLESSPLLPKANPGVVNMQTMSFSRDRVTPKLSGEAKFYRSQCGVNALKKHTTVKKMKI